MIIGIILITAALAAFILMGILCSDEPDVSVMSFMLGISVMAGIFMVCKELPLKERELKYPTTDYTLEYEIITRGEQVDSVYVLTRKQL